MHTHAHGSKQSYNNYSSNYNGAPHRKLTRIFLNLFLVPSCFFRFFSCICLCAYPSCLASDLCSLIRPLCSLLCALCYCIHAHATRRCVVNVDVDVVSTRCTTLFGISVVVAAAVDATRRWAPLDLWPNLYCIVWMGMQNLLLRQLPRSLQFNFLLCRRHSPVRGFNLIWFNPALKNIQKKNTHGHAKNHRFIFFACHFVYVMAPRESH